MVKSNITDNESAKMKASHGVIQGYTGVAAADTRYQVVVHAEAFGQGQEHGLLKPVIEGIRETLKTNDKQAGNELNKTRFTADSGYHNRERLEYLEREQADAYVAETGFRARDPRFKDYKAPKTRDKRQDQARFTQSYFKLDRKKQTCRCPAGHPVWLKAKRAKIGHHLFMQFQAFEKDCGSCGLRKRCLRDEKQSTPRQVNVALDITEAQQAGVIERITQQSEI